MNEDRRLMQSALFAAALLVFHSSEFTLAYVYQRRDLSFSSTLLSWEYAAAMCSAMLEHWLELRMWPACKHGQLALWVSRLGLLLIVSGEVLRKAAMLTAQCAFTHLIRYEKRDGHQLVRHGVYAWVRHPGYLGFFMWSVGTQLLLCNPICTAIFAVVVWMFFQQRIPVEESQLLKIIGSDYQQYMDEVPGGVPFIARQRSGLDD